MSCADCFQRPVAWCTRCLFLEAAEPVPAADACRHIVDHTAFADGCPEDPLSAAWWVEGIPDPDGPVV